MTIDLKAILSLQDNFSGQIKSIGGATVDTLTLINTGFAGMGGAAKSAFDLMKGNYTELGNLLGLLPGPIGIAGKAIGDSLGKAIDETVKYTESMRKASAATGASVAFISQFTEAADDQFISSETVVRSLEKLSKGLGGVQDIEGGVAKDGKGVAQVLKDMGIETEDANGKMISMEDLMPKLADKFKELGPGAKASALAVQLFGRAGQEMLPVLLQGSAAMEESMKKAKDMGLSIDQNAVTAVKRLKQQQDELNDSSTALGRKISLTLIPALTKLTDAANQLAGAPNPIEKMGDDVKVAKFKQAWSGIPDTLDTVRDSAKGAAQGALDLLQVTDKITLNEKELQKATDANSASFHEYTDETQAALDATNRDADAVEKNAAAQKELAARTQEVIGAISDQNAVMTEGERVKTILEIATGKLTTAQIDNKLATQAVMKALKDGNLTESDAIRTIKGLTDGTTTAQQAFILAGKSGDIFRTSAYGIKQAASDASLTVSNLGSNLKQLPTSTNVTLGASVGSSWDSIFGQNGVINSVHDSTATKYAAGSVQQSFWDAKNTFGGVYDNAATKRIFGASDGTFNAARDAYNQVVNGSATATIHVATDVTVNWTGYNCFTAGTMISTVDGDVAIEDITLDTRVLCYNHTTHVQTFRQVTRTFKHELKATWFVRAGDKFIHCTPEHPFYVIGDDKYVAANKLEPGVFVLGVDGAPVMIWQGWEGEPETVYNIEVPPHHNYYAGRVLVHNLSIQRQMAAGRPQGAGGAAASNAISFNNSFVNNAAMARQAAQIIQQAQAAATRNALLRASIGAGA